MPAAAAFLSLLALPTRADLQLPSVLSSNMVLQQGRSDAVWGWDTPGTAVTIAFRGQTRTAQAGADGRWQVSVPAGSAGGPFPLTITGSTAITLNNVLVGEVWVTGGQSNMWWHVANCTDAKAETAAAGYPAIRYWDANTSPTQAGWGADTPQRTVKAEWKVTTPQVVSDYAGVPYFFARDLYRTLKVPVGIVHISVPGTEIEQHLSPTFLQRNLPQAMELYGRRAREYPALKQQYDAAHAAWAVSKAGEEPKAPGDPQGNAPGWLYNGMVAPTAPFTCRGFLWWQGEYNADRSLQYRVLFPGLIEEWRQAWADETLPFLFVELANFGPTQTQPVEEAAWPSLRDAQREALRLPGTYEVSAIDVKTQAEGDWAIHPVHKQIVGHRLFLSAMANVYGRKITGADSPALGGVSYVGDRATITFNHAGSGLVARGGILRGFALAGADRQFYRADASLRGNSVLVTSPDVTRPVAVRYDWGNNPIGSLYNREGLPTFPFRTDQWNLQK